MLDRLAEKLVEGTQEVFSMMTETEVTGEEPVFGKIEDNQVALISMLGLGGDIKGLLAVHCTRELALGVTGSFLGIELQEIDEDVKDAVGEIANMIAGSMKLAFASLEVDTQLAIPTTVIGKSFKVSGFSKAEKLSVPFNCRHGRFWVELKFVKN